MSDAVGEGAEEGSGWREGAAVGVNEPKRGKKLGMYFESFGEPKCGKRL